MPIGKLIDGMPLNISKSSQEKIKQILTNEVNDGRNYKIKEVSFQNLILLENNKEKSELNFYIKLKE